MLRENKRAALNEVNTVGRYILDILYSYHYMSERKLNQVRRLIEIVDPGI